ncbi:MULTISPECIES: ABC-F family ATP-binding cassette domain-containing protein [unclassified Sphingobium]|uniref:ABC-F family ATP-binding cassette domain-containing protein n=1 Tax=unclassified Sphingobium TaxID=2611147 RepID=UPI002224695C|nr:MULTISPECIES: ATP-binding cassette domain-containing protein [unclassified Sphingobium]MCW2396117.1 ATPase subunit of ABC transporter with duplicated ATPase domains [Sphingobium sp. B8D3B]MCW2419633.1 ATPase subunit of ABC transporter with duplicated ATPase domains [Sphingobium sp. B8D3C]
MPGPNPALLTLDHVTLARPDGTALFSDLTLAIGRERVGLVGRNGAGKSSLLALIAEGGAPQAGTIHRTGRIGTLRQIQPDAGSVAQALGLSDALERLARLDGGEGSPEDAAEADWTLPERLERALADVGLTGTALDRDCATLSGGERTRVGLAAMLLAEPELLLLDEPTNNLDDAGRAAVGELLACWPGGALVASHDRALLEGMDRIVQLSPVGAFSVGGDWSAFVASRDAMRARAEDELDRTQRTLARQQRDAQAQAERKARRDKAGRTARARGDQPRILLGKRAEQAEQSGARERHQAERQIGAASQSLEAARAQVEVLTPLQINLPSAGLPHNRTVLRFEDVLLARGGRRLFGPLSFAMTGPERVAITGPNGSGKTSLLALAVGLSEPSAGTIHRGPGRIALLDQHADLLRAGQTLQRAMLAAHPGMIPHMAHEALARFAFRNRDALKDVAVLSGGERLRAALCVITSGPVPPQLLVLDEPTNHLDIESIELLEQAVADYDGALLVVSHDAAFLDRIGIEQRLALGVDGAGTRR